jgi:hypothetical protein
LGQKGCGIEKGGKLIPLISINDMYFVKVKIERPCEAGPAELMPMDLEVQESPEQAGVTEPQIAQPARGLPELALPSTAEIEQHSLPHLPYQPWCEECVAGRGRDRQHLALQPAADDEMELFQMDYFFLPTEDSENEGSRPWRSTTRMAPASR